MAADAERELAEIAATLRAINAAWTGGRAEDVWQYLDERIVMVQPGFQERIVGRPACVESYQEFARQAVIQRYEESETTIDVTGETAVASYRFAIDYAMAGQQYHDVGHDVFVFIRQDGHWRAVWRTLIPLVATT